MTNKDYNEARIEALEQELNHLKNFIIRDYSLKDISAETFLAMFNAYKKALNETEI
jgi:hypothetical protein